MAMPSHKPHPSLRRLPLLDGRTLTFSAVTGATHHLNQITQLLESAEQAALEWTEDSHPPFLDQQQVNQLHWLLRSYFWELVGAFDLMLQCVNERFQLGLAEHQVKWSNIPVRSGIDQEQPKWDQVRAMLTAAWDSEWYYEVRTYRNFAHRSFLQLTALIPKSGKGQLCLEHARQGQMYYEDLRVQLPKYLEALRLLAADVFLTHNAPASTQTEPEI